MEMKVSVKVETLTHHSNAVIQVDRMAMIDMKWSMLLLLNQISHLRKNKWCSICTIFTLIFTQSFNFKVCVTIMNISMYDKVLCNSNTNKNIWIMSLEPEIVLELGGPW